MNWHIPTDEAGWRGRSFPSGLFRTVCRVPGHLLNSGLYRVTLLVIKDGTSLVYRQEDAIVFEVADTNARREGWYGREPGVVQPLCQWKTERLEESEPRIL